MLPHANDEELAEAAPALPPEAAPEATALPPAAASPAAAAAVDGNFLYDAPSVLGQRIHAPCIPRTIMSSWQLSPVQPFTYTSELIQFMMMHQNWKIKGATTERRERKEGHVSKRRQRNDNVLMRQRKDRSIQQ